MITLGIEGTAHTLGVGVIASDAGATPEILADRKHMWTPATGGIHPREAANHHAERVGGMLRDALAEARIRPRDVDLVAFSRGPGLGPCLRTVATAARAFALTLDRPLVGVNHCVAHLEIARSLTPAEDPVLLYASGGNTQVIAYTRGRYRVLGETLDVGIGNMLDKFARELGQPFPGGPHVERLAGAAKETADLVDLPYTIRGMDVAFSGLLTAALAHRDRGVAIEELAFSMQETAFAMLTEVTERALAHVEKDEVVLGGGVACNERLRAMTLRMAEDRGARAWWPSKSLCVDNGVMIAHLGAVMHEAGIRQRLEDTVVDQRFRTDEEEVRWRSVDGPRAESAREGGFVRGAEARVEATSFLGREAVAKARLPKGYRHASLDSRLRAARTRMEARLLGEARRVGVRTPVVLDLDAEEGVLVMERLEGVLMKDALIETPARNGASRDALARLGAAVARLHRAGFVHGDLTTSNAMVLDDGGVALLDFGLGGVSEEDEARGVELHVLMETLEATHPDQEAAFAEFRAGYRDAEGPAGTEAALAEIVRRGRYRGT